MAVFNQRPVVKSVQGVFKEQKFLPRLGKIHLGVKVKNQKGTEYPKETDYFVVPEEYRKILGDKPKKLQVVFPLENLDVILPNSLKWYKSSQGVFCYGDGENGYRLREGGKSKEFESVENFKYNQYLPEPKNDKNKKIVAEHKADLEPIKCVSHCPQWESGDCKLVAHILCILPDVGYGGCFQIDTGSISKINSLRDSLDYVKALCGHFDWIPLDLKLTPFETHAQGIKSIHYNLKVELDVKDLNYINQLRENKTKLLPSPNQVLVLPEPTKDIETPLDTLPEDITDKESEPIKEMVNDSTALTGEQTNILLEQVNKIMEEKGLTPFTTIDEMLSHCVMKKYIKTKANLTVGMAKNIKSELSKLKGFKPTDESQQVFA